MPHHIVALVPGGYFQVKRLLPRSMPYPKVNVSAPGAS